MRPPHPIPYQGSKRALASSILATFRGRRIRSMYEPFAGSGAVTIAAAHAGIGDRYVIADSLGPLVEVWRSIVSNPTNLADSYERVWRGQTTGDAGYFYAVRDRFNAAHDPADLLYLLARCVKNAPRWSKAGKFNQSVDRRRLGVAPGKMALALSATHLLLRGRAEVALGDFAATIAEAGAEDLVYLDPPYEGTSGGRNPRYHQGLERDRLLAVLEDLNRRGVPWVLSYDGRCGEREYGSPLPASLLSTRTGLNAGRSSQSTLNGESRVTEESLYVSHLITRERPSRP